MKLSVVLLAAFASSLPLQPGEPTAHQPPPAEGAAPLLSPRATEPPSAPVLVGDPAPDFSWQTADRQWVGLRDLLAQGSVLLVFASDDAHLAAIERERDALLDLGVIPAAGVNARAGSAAGKARKLRLGYTVIPDSRRIVAAQYGALDEMRQSLLPAWFVIDRRGQVRSVGRGSVPTAGFPRIAATVLAIPTGDVAVPARTR